MSILREMFRPDLCWLILDADDCMAGFETSDFRDTRTHSHQLVRERWVFRTLNKVTHKNLNSAQFLK